MNAELFEPVGSVADASVATVAARGLPSGLVLVEAAAATFAAWLDARGLGAWTIFQTNADVDDLVRHAPEPGPAEWSPLDPLSGRPGTVHRLFDWRDQFQFHPAGVCLLAPQPAAVARWFYVDGLSGEYRSLALVAAPDERALERVVRLVRSRMHDAQQATWQIIRGSYVEKESMPRPATAADDGIILAPAIAERVDRELAGFFRPEVAAMYRAMGVSHRRGALLYGPPGNGKTSLIRALGGRLRHVAALILRANAAFDSDDLEFAIDLWTRQAPAMLVIEDLNWLMDRVNVSTFLNLLDGIDTPDSAGGLLLVASTNHPHELDAALSNRPGRFDVVIELPPPDAATRQRYFARHAATFEAPAIARFADEAHGLSFAHLGEVMRLAGLIALNDGRAERTAADVAAAIATVQAARREADDGFRGPPPAFGLHTLVKQP